MAVSPLAAAMLGNQGVSPMMAADPTMLAAMPDIQLGQAMQQEGISTAPAYPMQALARVAQTLAGRQLVQGGLGTLGLAYGPETANQIADTLAKTQPNNPAVDLLKSNNPVARMIGFQILQKTVPIQSEYQRTSPGQDTSVGPNKVYSNTGPMSEIGKTTRDAELEAARNNPQGAQAIGRVITKETMHPETGLPYPPTNVVPTPDQMSAARQQLAGGLNAIQQSGVTNTQPNGVAQEGQDIRNAAAPSMVQNIASAKATQQGAVDAMKQFTEKDTPAFDSAQSLAMRLDIIDHNINALGPSWMGAGADTKAEVAKAWNSTLDSFGVKGMHIDPTKVGTWEDFNKETTRAGMELIKSNFGGSREAASIIQMGRTAVPGVQNSYIGAKYVSATIRAANQMQMDLYNYKKQLAQNGQSLVGAEADFYKNHPPIQYGLGAITAQIPKAAVAHLRANPNLADQFDKQFGENTSEFLLGKAITHPGGTTEINVQ